MFRYTLRRAAFNHIRVFRTPNFCQLQPCPALIHGNYLKGRSSRSFHEFGAVSGSETDTREAANDTIYALSSAPGKAGIAVIRVSGSGCLDVYNGLCPSKPPPKPRYAGVRTLTEPGNRKAGGDGNIVDSDALVLYFPGPKTVTGEDVLELHVHGGSATIKAVLGAIPKCTSPEGVIRYAEPGEFTKRAFFNSRLDLAQVESLGDTLAAETEHQRRAAVRGNSGALGRTYESWREQLLLARGEIEALIDFSEDQHFDESPTELLANVTKLVEGILHSIRLHEMGSERSELLRNGIRIALLGPPNVGKSSLMNLIVGREASIISSEAGTTRDIVEASLDIRGYLCSFADTAGIRTKSASLVPGEAEPLSSSSVIGAIEQEGIRRARKKALDSDVIIVLASVEPTPSGGDGESSSHHIIYDLETLQLAAGAQQCLLAINKSDAVTPQEFSRLVKDFQTSVLTRVFDKQQQPPPVLTLSCKAARETVGAAAVGLTEAPGSVQTLIERLVQSFSSLTSLPDDLQHLLGVTERQKQLLIQCREHLQDFMDEASSTWDDCGAPAWTVGGGRKEPDIVLAAEHLRLAAQRLASITGRGEGGDVEEVLGVIFEK
ncbi:GTP-binding protein TrmE N-terminus-domain-containing protein [Apodospora peruviana]|uniref:GTP-binding protein TrmE N-terminus-domain-containing protein n=1 Tax=Apodospora peruviana TaxID=516989 RepID=A0AAE0IJJ0_9PEZI|nr:GTP-binding protein TrmE N-terminus-domain-containing protein [Apodospora peruviana]